MAVFTALGVALAILMRVSQSYPTITPPDHSDQQRAVAEIQQLSSPDDPLAALAPAAGSASTQAQANSNVTQIKKDKEKDNRVSEFFNVKSTDVVIALFTIGIAIYTRRLVNATIRLEGATIRLVKAGDGTAKKELRAYVHFSLDERSTTRLSAGEEPTVMLIIRNSGKTPAYDVIIDINMVLADSPLSVPLPPIPVERDSSKVVIQPGGEFHTVASLGRKLTPIEVAAVDGGEALRLYVYGTVTYEDAFGDSQITDLRVKTIKASNLPADVAKNPRGYMYCAEGNDAT
jgi:hypothetical protein